MNVLRSVSGNFDLGDSVESVAIFRNGRMITRLQNSLAKPSHSTDGSEDTFQVTDLLTSLSYVVSKHGSCSQLLVAVKDRVIVANVLSHADVPEVAGMLAETSAVQC